MRGKVDSNKVENVTECNNQQLLSIIVFFHDI
jgi:hypothetical protein